MTILEGRLLEDSLSEQRVSNGSLSNSINIAEADFSSSSSRVTPDSKIVAQTVANAAQVAAPMTEPTSERP
eukprot:CAMPEP_0115560920 /NCGR_PEP_ID=MMETSP0271-20121206/100717_1 /TAXON_ID=71861 /ORGANISM="Scrippsiella trochoidea, Strain CCMP3099" /LENGTH=70 /DNA_ID=CAMNT_0002995011 /DNA_START=20 /DNA_END=230 /DNA_ORIENTATION=-